MKRPGLLLLLQLGALVAGVLSAAPQFRDIQISDVTARGSRRAGQITGLREMPIRDVSLRNIRISANTGLVLQDAAGIRLSDVHIEARSGPAIKGERVAQIEIDGFRSAAATKGAALLEFTDVADLWIHEARAPAGTGTFLALRGAATRDVVLKQVDLRLARTPVMAGEGATMGAVRLDP
ncbi:MAG: hypothetical protein Q7S40_16645 [Opitutaceae bacterium]|nr:hypothetical protein [Opitutaceae bacterium]